MSAQYVNGFILPPELAVRYPRTLRRWQLEARNAGDVDLARWIADVLEQTRVRSSTLGVAIADSGSAATADSGNRATVRRTMTVQEAVMRLGIRSRRVRQIAADQLGGTKTAGGDWELDADLVEEDARRRKGGSSE